MRRNSYQLLWIILAVAVAVGATGCNKLKARDRLNKGVAAYKSGQHEQAIEHFKAANELDPELINARLYLATAYASQYIPGAPSEENLRLGRQAVAEFEKVLDKDPNNLSAIDGIGSILFNMGGNPFDREMLNRSKEFHMRHIRIQPSDPEPYYWVGVINWTVAYRGNKEIRAEWNEQNPRRAIKDDEPLTGPARERFVEEYGALVDEGIHHLDEALKINSEYENAMAYLNLLYRQKADQVASAEEREDYLKRADALVDKIKEIRQRQVTGEPGS